MRLLPAQGPERRRTVALLLILVALVAWVWWPAGAPAPPVTADAGSGSVAPAPSARAATTLESLTLPVSVRLEALGEDPPPLTIGRNLFRFGARPTPPPPPPVDTPALTALPPTPPRPTGPPPIPLRLTGRFEAPDGRVVVTLKDPSTGALFHAHEGEIVDGRYRLLKVGTQSVVVSYLDGTGQRTIPLGG